MVVKDSASKIEQKRIKDKALNEACVVWKEHKDKEGGLTSGKISERISEKYEITICAGTVRKKAIECTDEDYQCRKRRTKGLFEAGVWNFILGAVETTISLWQSSDRDDLTPPEIKKRLLDLCSYSEKVPDIEHLYKRVREALRDTIECGKPTLVELRRIRWSTFANLGH
eukprot:1552120-Ditylum_brightwellii.AAC.1